MMHGESALLLNDSENVVLAIAAWNITTLPDSDVAEAIRFRLKISFALNLGLRHIIYESKVS